MRKWREVEKIPFEYPVIELVKWRKIAQTCEKMDIFPR